MRFNEQKIRSLLWEVATIIQPKHTTFLPTAIICLLEKKRYLNGFESEMAKNVFLQMLSEELFVHVCDNNYRLSRSKKLTNLKETIPQKEHSTIRNCYFHNMQRELEREGEETKRIAMAKYIVETNQLSLQNQALLSVVEKINREKGPATFEEICQAVPMELFGENSRKKVIAIMAGMLSPQTPLLRKRPFYSSGCPEGVPGYEITLINL